MNAGDFVVAEYPYGEAPQAQPWLVLDASDADLLVAAVLPEAGTQAMLPALTDVDLSAADREWLQAGSHVRLDKLAHLPRMKCRPAGSLAAAAVDAVLRTHARRAAAAHYRETRGRSQAFVPGLTPVPVSGKVLGEAEVMNLVDAGMDAWLTTGRFNAAFEQRLAAFLGKKHVLTVNSGSSANLVAFTALTSPLLGERALKPGDEVITVAAGFPTTVNPILQNGMVPVFVDIELGTYNVNADLVAAAISEKTRAIMLAHTLGNPFNIAEITRLARQYDLWLIEDCCDALGSTYDGQLAGSFGDIGTLSFYPAHHITMGEGGAVFTDNDLLKRIMESIRDWGRDCYCAPGCDNTCGKRFAWQCGELPFGYDHKYTYSHLGYNLKISDMQAAVGLAQLDRLPGFVEARKQNFQYLKSRLRSIEEFVILPEATQRSDPAWFGFPLTLREGAEVHRGDLIEYLEQYKIGTRLLFAGNLTRQPYFSGRLFRVASSLANTDRVMRQTFWIGLYPGLTETMLDYAADRLEVFFGANF